MPGTGTAPRPRAAREAPPDKPTAKAFMERLEAKATEAERRKYDRYFPPAARGGDVFIGVRMGTVFELARAFAAMPPSEIEQLLDSEIHEARAGAVSTMARQYALKATTDERRKELYRLYLRQHDRINAWDLVDLGAYQVVGAWLVGRPHAPLFKLAKSNNPWERRTAIVATYAFIRRGDCRDTFAIAELLRNEPVELVQKAAGWMLRCTGRDRDQLTAFLEAHAAHMPRAMLRNAIETFPPAERARFLAIRP
ncbi:MAG TPA: DNA alkylation repair protein [Alphaproteobacteria bacterium]|nr:DNA alkylation repair protein [Alphaproteobacteria bacterium]